MSLILVTGGARSGKSDFAQALAVELGGEQVAFVATAEAGDEEMAQRIQAHRKSRPVGWQTIEAPRRVDAAIQQAGAAKGILIDCLTLLVSNVLLSDGEAAVEDEVRGLLEAVRAVAIPVIVVTNEVGLGIVPDNPLARLYRDLLGRANARLAREADRVYLLVSGIPVEIKSLAEAGGT